MANANRTILEIISDAMGPPKGEPFESRRSRLVAEMEKERDQLKASLAELGKDLIVANAQTKATGDVLLAQRNDARAEVKRLLSVARGCHDYNGGHLDEPGYSTYHHGIQTVINALEAAVKDPKNMQVRVLESIGKSPASEDQP